MGQGYDEHWRWMGDHMSGWMGGWMGLWWLVALALLVWVIWVAARGGRGSESVPPGDSPETVLKRRYARGDIDREEFDRRLSDLRR